MKKIVTRAIFFYCLCFSGNYIYAQSPSFIKGDLYLLYCSSTLDNGRPISIYLVCNNLTFFSKHQSNLDQDAFMCNLYDSSILLEEPFLTFSKNINWFKFKSEEQANNYLNGLSKKIKNLNKLFTPDVSIKFNNGQIIKIKFVKIDGEFWQIKRDISEFNYDVGNFQVSKECYKKDYVYNIKKTNTIYKLNYKSISPAGTRGARVR